MATLEELNARLSSLDELNKRLPGAEPEEDASIAKDVGKSAVSGVGQGFTSLAGLPGDIAGLFPDEWRDSPDKRLPTSKDTQKAAEKYTGEFYKPQTTAGKYAHTVGTF